MMQKPEKPPAPAEHSPVTGSEIAWIAVLLSLCFLVNSWMMSQFLADPETLAAPATQASPAASAPAPAAVPERPSRDRTDRGDREWRDPAAAALPSL